METRRKITLPVMGGTVTVRKLCGWDMANIGESIPMIYAEPQRLTELQKKRNIEFGIVIAKASLTKCCSRITTKTGKKLTIVDKELDEVADSEITIGELDDQDAKAIMDTVAELTNMGKEVADKVKTFPEESATPDSNSPALQIIPSVAVRDTVAAVG